MSKNNENTTPSLDLNRLTPEEKKKIDEFMEELFSIVINDRSNH